MAFFTHLKWENVDVSERVYRYVEDAIFAAVDDAHPWYALRQVAICFLTNRQLNTVTNKSIILPNGVRDVFQRAFTLILDYHR